jgi:hypothetical protein
MAVISTKEIKRTGEVDSQNYRTYSVEWLLETDNPQDGPIQVSAALGLILWSSSYGTGAEADPYAKCKSITVEPVSGELYFWQIIATYDNRPYDTNAIQPTIGSGSPTQPTAPTPPSGTAPQFRAWQVKFGARQTEEFLVEDINGKKAVASNGQPYEGGLAIPKALPYFSLTAYTLQPNYQKVGQYVNRCNDAPFLGYNTYTLRCSDYQIQSQFEDQWGWYFQKDITFEINDDGWDLNILDAGTHSYSPSTGWTPIKDAFGQPVTSPVPLNGAGLPIIPPANPVFTEYQVYRLRNFNNIL